MTVFSRYVILSEIRQRLIGPTRFDDISGVSQIGFLCTLSLLSPLLF